MSILDELIKEICPNGMEYRILEEAFSVYSVIFENANVSYSLNDNIPALFSYFISDLKS